MTTKTYDIAILTSGDRDAGTSAEVWLKFDGSAGTTGWFAFSDPDEPPERRHFGRGQIDYGSIDFADLGDPQTCTVELRGDADESWIPCSVELIDGGESHTWQFGNRIRTGEQAVQDSPLRGDTLTIGPKRQSEFSCAVAEARLVLIEAESKWRVNDPTAPSPDQILEAILSVFENRRLIHRDTD